MTAAVVAVVVTVTAAVVAVVVTVTAAVVELARAWVIGKQTVQG